jgi:hypothetical protein
MGARDLDDPSAHLLVIGVRIVKPGALILAAA